MQIDKRADNIQLEIKRLLKDEIKLVQDSMLETFEKEIKSSSTTNLTKFRHDAFSADGWEGQAGDR